jgi:hypothetical protein
MYCMTLAKAKVTVLWTSEYRQGPCYIVLKIEILRISETSTIKHDTKRCHRLKHSVSIGTELQ